MAVVNAPVHDGPPLDGAMIPSTANCVEAVDTPVETAVTQEPSIHNAGGPITTEGFLQHVIEDSLSSTTANPYKYARAQGFARIVKLLLLLLLFDLI